MLVSFIIGLGFWTWWIVGLTLLMAELVMPGVFLLWIGLAALGVGLLSVLLLSVAIWTWEVQFLVFAVLAVALTLVGRRIYAPGRAATDEPFLNRRGEGLVGRTATLEEPIREGRGRIRLDDTLWPVSGPDLPAGTRVRVVAAQGRDLVVEPA